MPETDLRDQCNDVLKDRASIETGLKSMIGKLVLDREYNSLVGRLERADKEKFNLLRDQMIFSIKNEIFEIFAYEIGQKKLGKFDDLKATNPELERLKYIKDMVEKGKEEVYDKFDVREEYRK